MKKTRKSRWSIREECKQFIPHPQEKREEERAEEEEGEYKK